MVQLPGWSDAVICPCKVAGSSWFEQALSLVLLSSILVHLATLLYSRFLVHFGNYAYTVVLKLLDIV